MKQSGKRILKVKRRGSTGQPKKSQEEHAPFVDSNASRQKRANPFSHSECSNKIRQSDSVYSKKVELPGSKLLGRLDAIHTSNDDSKSFRDVSFDITDGQSIKENIPKLDFTEEHEKHKENEERAEETYCSSSFPLDWSIKQRVKLISTKPLTFCDRVKSADKASGIKKFATDDKERPNFYQHLCLWIHPLIPGIQNFPLKKTILAAPIKDGVSATTGVNSNRLFQEALLQQWRISFQSLFNMLKTDHCMYFYLCGHQFSVLFKAQGIGNDNISAVLTPTTKGLRSILTNEGIEFEYTHQEHGNTFVESLDDTSNEEKDNATTDHGTCGDADLFLDSLGLSKDEHFPKIEEQRKLAEKSKLRLLDDRPESTVEIRNCQGFFNYLLNSPFLCAPSGRMIGLPPTLISSTPFEGSTLYINKYTYGIVKNKVTSSHPVHCLEINGFILPSQLNGIVDLHIKSTTEEFYIQSKGYGNTFAFNSANNILSGCLGDQFLNKAPTEISDQSQVHYADNIFKF